jgi:hypothetical protein
LKLLIVNFDVVEIRGLVKSLISSISTIELDNFDDAFEIIDELLSLIGDDKLGRRTGEGVGVQDNGNSDASLIVVKSRFSTHESDLLSLVVLGFCISLSSDRGVFIGDNGT